MIGVLFLGSITAYAAGTLSWEKGAGSSTPWWEDEEISEEDTFPEPDPLEPLNRVLFHFNRIMDGILLKPIAIIYDDTLPIFVKESVGHFIDNIFSPVTFLNHALQGQGTLAIQTAIRFALNSTVGLFGLMDPAKGMGIPHTPATFNQTLSTWGMETGPYVMIPFVGPSSFRGIVGMAGDIAMNPMTYFVANTHRHSNRHKQQEYLWFALYGLDIVNRRSQLITALNDIERDSLDPYVTIRSIFFQKQYSFEKKEGS